jgi:hypothetical protein
MVAELEETDDIYRKAGIAVLSHLRPMYEPDDACAFFAPGICIR